MGWVFGVLAWLSPGSSHGGWQENKYSETHEDNAQGPHALLVPGPTSGSPRGQQRAESVEIPRSQAPDASRSPTVVIRTEQHDGEQARRAGDRAAETGRSGNRKKERETRNWRRKTAGLESGWFGLTPAAETGSVIVSRKLLATKRRCGGPPTTQAQVPGSHVFLLHPRVPPTYASCTPRPFIPPMHI